jgi:hypothetical protein
MSGSGQVTWNGEPVELSAVQFVLLPAVLGDFTIETAESSVFLRIFVSE